MSRRFTIVTVALTAVVAFLVGAIVAGGFGQNSIGAGEPAPARRATSAATRTFGSAVPASLVNFADVVERINPAVVNIDATTRAIDARRRRRSERPEVPDPFPGPQNFNGPRNYTDTPRRGAGSGCIIDAD